MAAQNNLLMVKMEDVETESPLNTKPSSVTPANRSPASTVIVKTEPVVKLEDVDNVVSHAPIPLAPAERKKIAQNLQTTRIILQRLVKEKLAKGTPLSDENIKKISEILGFLNRLGKESEPILKEWKIAKALKVFLGYSRILPDYLPPHIAMLLISWNRGQYNPLPTYEEDSEPEADSAPESEDSDSDVDTSTDSMRGVIKYRGKSGGICYKLKPGAQRPAAVFGHNGLEVGAWWPKQICALRDGAHGSRMGGIAGKREMGAYSIVVSGGAGYEDEDLGDTLWYTGSGEAGNGQDQPLTNMNQALQTSCSLQRPIRVLRGAKNDSQYAPTRGLRYDGLYKITDYGHKAGRDGYRRWKFKLERLPGQDPIRRHIPTLSMR